MCVVYLYVSMDVCLCVCVWRGVHMGVAEFCKEREATPEHTECS